MAKTEVVKEPAPTSALARRRAAELAPVDNSPIIASLADLARDVNVTPEKLNAMIDVQVRIMDITAKQAFDRDFALMQAKLPTIDEGGMATVKKDGKLIRKTPYARDVDITEAVRPILAKFGFAIRHKNKFAEGLLTVTGILSHKQGHREEDEFTTPRDDSAGKNIIQSWGSARKYGKRYTTMALLGIATKREPGDPLDDDDDGGATGEPQGENVPRGETRTRKPDKQAARAPLSKDEKVISEDQRKRLWTIFRNSGRNEEALRSWLHTRFGYDSTSDITRKNYDEIVKAIESKGPLPLAAAKEQK